ncbi:glyoxalase superfamily protein [Methylobacterium sp. SyP6R]|uniref:glyoxalase superfamily protein n=1 Tax=Methylobacterium sp. SyP6R TaxID=2718876 RepID=UPI003FA564F1
MRTYRDAKAMAKALREELGRRGSALSHGECLEIVARQFGLDNWNILSASLTASAEPGPEAALVQPAGWIVSGSKPHLYDMGIDPAMPYGDGRAALIRCRYAEDDPAYAAMEKGFATMMQSIVAAPYRGRRVCLSADLRVRDVAGAATLWLRADAAIGRTVAFDNMEERATDGPLTGTRGWTSRRIVLDVPTEAETLHFGFYLRGSGRAWAGGFALREASPEDAATVLARVRPEPTNLDFAQAMEARATAG